MKLIVNKEHKKGDFKKNKQNIYLKIDTIVILIALFSGVMSSALEYNLNKEEVIKISEDARNSIYLDNKELISPYEEFFHLKFSEPEEEQIDKKLTIERLESIDSITLDLEKNTDLRFLKHCKNIKTLTLKNCAFLTNEHLSVLNNLNNNSSIIFYLNMKDIVKLECSKTINFNILSKTVTILFERTERNNLQELESQLIFTLDSQLPANYILDYVKTPINYELDSIIDEKLEKIDFSDCYNEEEKLFKIIGFLLDYIDYDEEVQNYFSENDTLEKGTYIYNKCLNYNNNTLSSVLNNQDEVTGICCNYSSIFSIICNKLGIENHYISGKLSDNLNNHAWNLVKIDGKYKFVDLTNCDTLSINNYYDSLDKLDKQSKLEIIETLKAELLTIINDESLKYYLSENDIKALTKQTVDVSEVIYYNESIDGESVNNKGVNHFMPMCIMIGELVIYVIVDSKINKKKRDNNANKLK